MIILCSGGFDPLHEGHLAYFEEAARYGKLVVAVNSDAWLKRKKGFVFMPRAGRARIVAALRCVHRVYEITEDGDGTVCQALEEIRPDYFANGGDRTNPDPTERAMCIELGIVELFNVGGGKIASSSDLVKAAHDHHAHPVQD